MDKFHYGNGSNFYGIFRELPMSGSGNAVRPIPEPSYTINSKSDDLPSAHEIYMNSQTEYDAAMKLVPDWDFWREMLKASTKITRVVENWREEKLLQDQAAAKKLLWEQAEKGNVTAQRVLYESKKEEARVKAQEARAAKESAKHEQLAEATIQRLKVIK